MHPVPMFPMRLLRLCLLLLLPLPGSAQEQSKVTCRFLSLEGSPPPPPLLNPGAEGEEVACKVPANNLSPETVCHAEGGAIRFLDASDRKVAATAKVPAGVKNAILLFIPAPKDKGVPPWRVFVIEDTARNIPDGGAFVANFNSQDIRFVIGERKLMLRSGGSHAVPRPEKRDTFNMAPVVFQFQRKEKWATANESMLRFTPGVRYLIFAYIDPGSGRPHVATYQDLPRAPVEPVSP